MITVRSFGNHKLSTISLDKASFLKRTVWIDCENPTKEEITALVKKTGIAKSDILDCLDKSEKPRLQRNQDHLLFILGVPFRKDHSQIDKSPLGLFLSKRFLLTVHKHKIEAFKTFLKKDDTALKEIFKLGKERIAYNLLMSILKDFYAILEEMEKSLEKIENKVVKSANSVLNNIMALKKTLLYVRTTLIDNREVVISIKESTWIKKRELFQDLYVEFAQQVDMVEIFRERLTGALEIYYSSVSNKLNQVMKYFTVIASLIMLPTLISGIYGMNFLRLPLKEHPNGFWIMIGIMLISMLIMFFFFKREKWV